MSLFLHQIWRNVALHHLLTNGCSAVNGCRQPLKPLFKVKNVLIDLFRLLKTLIDGLEWCGLLVDYCDVFISCLDSHSDGTHSLKRIHCWDTDALLHFSKSDEETNSSTSLDCKDLKIYTPLTVKLKLWVRCRFGKSFNCNPGRLM